MAPQGTELSEIYRPPPYQVTIWTTIGAAVVIVLALTSIRFAHTPDSPRPTTLGVLPPDAEAVLADAPEMDDEYWPCSDCHEPGDTNPKRRELDEEHDEMDFEHGTTWCLDCHDADDRDKLHLASGELVAFDESWKLCTQCHGAKLADWRAGVHGKRTGHWRGEKQFLPCVSCHNPHGPHFQGIKPKAAPTPPAPRGASGADHRAPSTGSTKGGAKDEH